MWKITIDNNNGRYNDANIGLSGKCYHRNCNISTITEQFVVARKKCPSWEHCSQNGPLQNVVLGSMAIKRTPKDNV